MAPRKVPAYRAPGDGAASRRANPAIPTRDVMIFVMPRWRVRSAINPTATVTTAAAAYGGTLSSCALNEV